MAHPKTEPFDVRGGICGAQKNNAPCRQPLLAGWCPEHKVRAWTPAPTKPSAPHIGKGKYTSHSGLIDGRTRAGRALKHPERTQPNGRRRTDKQTMARIRPQFRQQGAQTQAPCWICTMPIDYTNTDQNDDDTWEPDHFYPRSTHPQFAEDPTNLRHSHQAVTANAPTKHTDMHTLGTPTRNWFG